MIAIPTTRCACGNAAKFAADSRCDDCYADFYFTADPAIATPEAWYGEQLHVDHEAIKQEEESELAEQRATIWGQIEASRQERLLQREERGEALPSRREQKQRLIAERLAIMEANKPKPLFHFAANTDLRTFRRRFA